jgi:hypothetical protein
LKKFRTVIASKKTAEANMCSLQIMDDVARAVAVSVSSDANGYRVRSDLNGVMLCSVGPFRSRELADRVADCVRGTVREAFKQAINEYAPRVAKCA